ncbi:hypothetical protein FIC_01296 [Flavobacteriaceae bacterium 3519-10]|nr:hypothetical protein FIC_01296 [Flavobacteriaceae bacterium 3519-10]
MISIFITILGHIAYGITNVLWKNPRNELGTLPLIIVRSFVCMLIFGLAFIILSAWGVIPYPTVSAMDIVGTLGICAVNYFGLFFFLKSMKHAPVSHTIGFGKIGLVIGIAGGYFVYGEEISLLKVLMAIVVLIGVSMIEFSSQKRPTIISKGLLYAILCKFFWGTAYLYVPFINKLGPILFCAILEFTVCTMSIILFLWKPTKIKVAEISSRTKYEVGLLILLGMVGTFCLNFALANISIIMFAVIGLIEPIIGLVISKVYHKEKLSRIQQIGIAAGVTAAFILSATK